MLDHATIADKSPSSSTHTTVSKDRSCVKGKRGYCYFWSLMKGSLFFRNLLFTILQPGIVVGLLPYLLGKHRWAKTLTAEFSQSFHFGILVLSIGSAILAYCIYQLAKDGNGTLSPADPTQNLVIRGLYRYSRNPMYIGVMLILIGESLILSSLVLWAYSLCVFAGFNLFIVFHEEPRLKRDFGLQYEEYCKCVRRWL